MMQVFSLIALFIFTLIVEVSFIQSFTGPVAAVPILFIMGILLMHRMEAMYGVLWFVASGVCLSFFQVPIATTIAFFVCSILAFFFVKKLFATRSVYALTGLGISTFTVFSLTEFLVTVINHSSLISIQIYQAAWGFIFVVPGLYTGFVLARKIERAFEERFFIHHKI